MAWLAEYWWLIIILLMVVVLINVYRDLRRIDVKKFLNNKPKLPPHRDNNAQWDDDWPKKP